MRRTGGGRTAWSVVLAWGLWLLTMLALAESKSPVASMSATGSLALVTASSTTPTHLVALVQARSPGCAGHHYFRSKLAEGKTTREAIRCLKRQIAGHVWRVMLTDEQTRQHPGPKRFDTQRRPWLAGVKDRAWCVGRAGH